jgi:short-subunit dehydrogenase
MQFRLAQCEGDWALVTGASAGIGREFALQLAARGVNVIVVARREPLLHALAIEIEQAHRVRVLPLALDLSKPGAGQSIRTRLEELGDIRLCVVVNNAACGRWGPFETTDANRYAELVQLNCAAVVAVTAALLPMLKQSAPSALINVSSQAAYQPVPYMAVYAASKAFVQSFSQALYAELAPARVLVQTLVPAPTVTDFDQQAGAYASAVIERGSTVAVVAAALAGLEKGAAIASNKPGLWKQRLFAGLFSPEFVVRQVAKMFRPPEG